MAGLSSDWLASAQSAGDQLATLADPTASGHVYSPTLDQLATASAEGGRASWMGVGGHGTGLNAVVEDLVGLFGRCFDVLTGCEPVWH